MIILEYTSKYINAHTNGDPKFTPVTLPPPALRITIQRQSQANDRQKMFIYLVDEFTRGLRRQKINRLISLCPNLVIQPANLTRHQIGKGSGPIDYRGLLIQSD